MKQHTRSNLPVRRSSRRRWRPSRGTALIEMVVALVLFYLVMGGVEFGWYMYAKHIVQSAARDGQGIITTPTTAQVNAAITATMTSANFQGTGYTTKYEEATTSSGGTTTYATTTDVTTVDRGNGLHVTISAAGTSRSGFVRWASSRRARRSPALQP